MTALTAIALTMAVLATACGGGGDEASPPADTAATPTAQASGGSDNDLTAVCAAWKRFKDVQNIDDQHFSPVRLVELQRLARDVEANATGELAWAGKALAANYTARVEKTLTPEIQHEAHRARLRFILKC